MRKRRVLALLLALSLVVSGNGMTVLAAEQGSDMPVLASQEETADTENREERSEEDASDGTEDSSDEEKDPSAEGENPSAGEEKPSEEEIPETPDESDENDPSVPGADDGQGDDQSSDGEQSEDQTPTEDEEDAEQDEEPVEDIQDPTVSENDVDEIEEPEEAPEEKTGEVRMMSFTDDAGLRITFDANAAEENAEKVTITDDGVLTGIDDSVEGVVDLREKTIKAVGENAFQSKTKITYVMLPKTVETLGAGAFEDCTALKGVSIPSRLATIGDRAFKGCTSLTQMALPNSVISIGESAFNGDARLFMLHMRSAEYSKLQTIGESAFYGCSSLEFFCSDDSYNLPVSLTTIGKSAFENCTNLSVVDMSRDKITSLGEGAYKGCTGIREVTLSSALTTISVEAFANCSGLQRITFGNARNDLTTEIAGSAFLNCTGLSSVFLPEQVQKVCSNAFGGCSELRRVEVDSGRTMLEANALPNENKADGMCIVGKKQSMAKTYADDASIPFIAKDDSAEKYYTYRGLLTGYGTDTATKITMIVSTSKDSAKDINTIENGAGKEKGVTAGTPCYIIFKNNGIQAELVKGSVKCNGEAASYKDGFYMFNMPVGGATITAEFKSNGEVVTVDGDETTIEGRLSAEADYDAKENTGYLKVGQSAKFYLTNSKTGSVGRIPASKVTYIVTPNSERGVVDVFSDGTVKALKEGTASVMASVTTTARENGTNKVVSKFVTIVVEKSGINHISMRVEEDGLDSYFKLNQEERNISIATEKLTRPYTFEINAVAFSSEDDDGEMETAFTWTTSDQSVAKLAKTSTPAGNGKNTVTVPVKADGEATITVTATNADKTKVTQKFVVSAQTYTPRLTASKITVNPNQILGATELGIISAYNKAADKTDVKILDAATKTDYGDFKLTYNSKKSTDAVSVYNVEARDGLKETTYKVLVQTKVEGFPYQVPLTITVKSSLPNPTVSFDRKQEKLNLFYAHSDIEFIPVINKLGKDDQVVKFELEPLSKAGDRNYEDDVKFIENFGIDESTGVIKQKRADLLCNKSNRPVVSGYLVLSFKDYKEKATKKYKITIPTQTTAPTYALDRTSDTFWTRCKETQTVNLRLLDKKTKKPILWDADFKLDRGMQSTCDAARAKLVEVTEKVDGVEQSVVGIQVTVDPNPGRGRLSMILTNTKWAAGKSFTYNYDVKTDNNPAKLKLQKTTITLNANYPEKAEELKLVSNQYDTRIEGEQKFVGQPTAKNAEIYKKLRVTCKNGDGTVSFANIADAKDVPAGSYKYLYTYVDANNKENRITLTVRVVRTAPTVTLRGTNAFNLQAWTKEDDKVKYIETSEMTVTAKNLPDAPKYLESPVEPEEPGQPENPDGSGQPDQPENPGGSDGSGQPETPGGSEGTDQPGGDPAPAAEPAQQLNPEYYAFDEEATFNSIEFATKGFENPKEYFKFEWVEGEKAAEGKIRISLQKDMPVKTYSLKMTPTYKNASNTIQTARPVTFSIRIYSGDIKVRLGAKGKINLLNRAAVQNNGIQYTPVFTNLKDTVKEVRLLDASDNVQGSYDDPNRISKQFTAVIAEDGKSFYVVPIEGQELENRKSYALRVWIKTTGYNFPGAAGGGIYVPGAVKINTAEVLPKVTTDETAVDLFLSNKTYEAEFTVKKADVNSIGTIKSIAFGEKDEKARDSFDIQGVTSEKDGSLKVTLKLKNGVSYGCNSTNRITMYIQFEGQGTNTAGTPINMSVKINK